jgi:hypothetical protein
MFFYKGVRKRTCLILIRTTRLDLDASCNDNGPNLSNPAPCFLVPIIVKCNKLVTMEAPTFRDSNSSTCFIDNELMSQYKLALMEKSTLMPFEVMDDHNISSGLITHETKALDHWFSHQQGFFQCHFIFKKSYHHWIVCLALHNPLVNWHTKSLHFETPQHKAFKCKTLIRCMHVKNQDGVCHVIKNKQGDECMQNLK